LNTSAASYPTADAVAAERARRHLGAFIRQAWPIAEPTTPFVSGWHLDCIVEHLEAVTRREIRNLLINVPPRHMKSLAVAVFWPIWTWTTSPSTRWLFNSYAESLSIRDSLKCRRIIQSPWYQTHWGHVFALTSDQNVKSRFENDRTGYRIAASVGGANTGEGGDFLVCDDPHNVLEADSDLIREGVLTWWDETMATRLNDPKTGCRVIVMQRCHERDLAGHLIERGGYHHLCLPAEYEPRVYVTGARPEAPAVQPHDECSIAADQRTTAGALLWPERFGVDEVATLKRDLGPYGTAGQLQQRPVPREGIVFKAAWFRPLPADFDEPRTDGKTLRQRLRCVQFWDLAWSEKASADYTAAVTLGMDASGNGYLLHVYRERIDEEGLAEAMAAHIVQTRPQVVGVEEGAYKQAATRDLVRLINRALAGAYAVGVLPVAVTRDKVFRAQLPAGRAQSGMMYADRLAPWWATFEAELLQFPKGAHDDQVDALSGALQLAIEWAPTEQPKPVKYTFSSPVTPKGFDWQNADSIFVDSTGKVREKVGTDGQGRPWRVTNR
jgi:predicted phage terminase large subunit-like protein